MTQDIRIKAFAALGNWMTNLDDYDLSFIKQLQHKNPWYTPENVIRQLSSIGRNLTIEQLNNWVKNYNSSDSEKNVGLILAGNIPLVGFHDVLSTLIMGFNAKIKVSSDDAGLTQFVLSKLIFLAPDFEGKMELVEKLVDFDLVIATGSNNSSRYFEYYFGKKPHIIRKSRNAVAVIHGHETKEELALLGNDIFDYFGLGCRSVSKIFIPMNFNINLLFEALEEHSGVNNNFKYNNNYDYNKSIYLINGEKHYDNGFLLLKKDRNIASPLAVVFYEEYSNLEDVLKQITNIREHIQCVVSSKTIQLDLPIVKFGESQSPKLDDYADNINTLEFLDKNR